MKDETERITIYQAYRAMMNFLEGYYNRTHSDDIGSLLGDISLTIDGKPMDPAAHQDWIDSVNKSLNEG